MLQKFKKCCLWSCPGLLLFAAFLQVKPPEQLLDQYFQAIGQEQLSRIPSLFIKGKLVPASGEDVYFKMYTKDMNKLHVEWARSGSRWREVYNEGRGWKVLDGQTTPLEGQALFNLALLARVASPLHGLPADKLESGEVKVEEESFHLLKLQLADEKIEFLFDKEDHLLAYQRVSVSENSSLIPQEIKYRKYRDLGGVKIAFAYTIKTNTTTSDLIFDELVLGYPAPAALFNPQQ